MSWRGAPQLVLLRPVGGPSPVHRLWAGTKLLAVAALSLTLSFEPSWVSVGLGAGLVALGILLAHVPLSARPRLGWWLAALIVIGGLLTLVTGGRPEVAVAGGHIGFGAFDSYCRLTAYGAVILTASLLLGWTTPAAELAPALAALGRPFRIVRLPVDEWAVTVALTVRCLPLLVQEVRTLLAARRLRPAPDRAAGLEAWLDARLDAVADLLVAIMAVAIRRASEMAEAITARGGTGQLSGRQSRPGRADAVAGLTVGATCAAAWVLSVLAS